MWMLTMDQMQKSGMNVERDDGEEAVWRFEKEGFTKKGGKEGENKMF